MLAIGAFGEANAQTLGSRIERIFKRLKIDPAQSADIVVSDEDDALAWAQTFAAAGAVDAAAVEDRSPSGLRRLAVPK